MQLCPPYNPLRTLLHMQSCPGLCKNRPVGMYMTEHSCTAYVYAACLFTYIMIAVKTQTAEHFPCHDMHLTCKMAHVFRRPRAFNLLPERFFTGVDTTAYANVSRRTQLHYAALPGGHELHICKTVRRTLLHMQ